MERASFSARHIRRRFLAPAAQKAGAPSAGFHSFRHCYASMLFKRGANAVEVQHRLGHHSAAFTMHQYVHLLEGDAGRALDLEVELAGARTRNEHDAIVRAIRPADVAVGVGG